MKILFKVCLGINAAFKGMWSVAGFAILALLLTFTMLKIKGSEGREIARANIKLNMRQASVYESPMIPEITKEILIPKSFQEEQNSFSFGNSIEQDHHPVLDLSRDPNEK